MNMSPANGRPRSRSPADPRGLFDAVFDGVDEAILILDEDPATPMPTISDVNMTFERWTEIEKRQIKGVCFADAIVSDLNGGLGQLVETFANARGFEMEAALISRSQTAIPVHISVQQTASANGRKRFTAVARRSDKIERQAAELARRERDLALQARERLFSRLSHDLRTPLNGILGFSEIMKEELLGSVGDDRYRSYAQNIHSAGKQLLWRIEELLDLKSLEEGSWRAEEQTFDLCQLVGRIGEEVADFNLRERPAIKNQVPAGLPLITADRNLLEKALSSLLMSHLLSEIPCDSIRITAGLTSRGEILLCTEVGFTGPSNPLHSEGCMVLNSLDDMEITADDEYPLAKALVGHLGGQLVICRADRAVREIGIILPAYRIG